MSDRAPLPRQRSFDRCALGGARILRGELELEARERPCLPRADGHERDRPAAGILRTALGACPVDPKLAFGAESFRWPGRNPGVERLRPLDGQVELPRDVLLRSQVPGRLLHRFEGRGSGPCPGQRVCRAEPSQGAVGILLCVSLRSRASLLTSVAEAAGAHGAALLDRLLGQAKRAARLRKRPESHRGSAALSRLNRLRAPFRNEAAGPRRSRSKQGAERRRSAAPRRSRCPSRLGSEWLIAGRHANGPRFWQG